MRGGAEVARRAHNPKVVGSNPAPATTIKLSLIAETVFLMLSINFCICNDFVY